MSITNKKYSYKLYGICIEIQKNLSKIIKNQYQDNIKGVIIYKSIPITIAIKAKL